jgi:LacI family transcriptional regulator
MRVRQQDIARATGFSINTVSLALRGSPRIGEGTRKLILAEAERLNYSPNRIAQLLVGSASRTVGLILTDVMNPTLTLAARTIERKLSEAHYGMMFAASGHDVEAERRALLRFQSYQVDGVLVYPADNGRLEHLERARDAGVPVILLANAETTLDVVTVDDEAGARKAVGHLLARGHRRIGMIDGSGTARTSPKVDGALRALAEAGLPRAALEVVRPEGNSARDGHSAMGALAAGRPMPTAVFASTDALAIGALKWCAENGRSVPADLAVMGYDNTEIAAYCALPLSTVHYAADTISALAVDRLIEVVETDRREPPVVRRLVEPELIVRGTT